MYELLLFFKFLFNTTNKVTEIQTTDKFHISSDQFQASTMHWNKNVRSILGQPESIHDNMGSDPNNHVEVDWHCTVKKLPCTMAVKGSFVATIFQIHPRRAR